MVKTYCIFTAFYLPHMGGVEKYTANLSRALIDAGNEVVIVTSGESACSLEKPFEALTIVRLPSFALLGGRFPVPKKGKQYRSAFKDLLSLDIDYVIVNTRFYLLSLEGLRFASVKGVRPIMIEHGSAHLTLGAPFVDRAVKLWEHAITRVARKYHPVCYAVSNAGCDWVNHFGIKAHGVLSNAIDVEEFRSNATNRDFRSDFGWEDDDFLCVFVGRLVPEKGVSQLIGAARKLESEKKIRFVIAGEGPLSREVEETCLSNLRYVGKLSGGDVSALFSCADVFCLPSRSEGFSTSLLECVSCECVPLTTWVGGVDELLGDDHSSLVLSSIDADEIARRIAYLYRNQEMLSIARRELLDKVREKFTWEVTAKNLSIACERIVDLEQ